MTAARSRDRPVDPLSTLRLDRQYMHMARMTQRDPIFRDGLERLGDVMDALLSFVDLCAQFPLPARMPVGRALAFLVQRGTLDPEQRERMVGALGASNLLDPAATIADVREVGMGLRESYQSIRARQGIAG